MKLSDLQDNFSKKFQHLTALHPVSQWRHWLAKGVENTGTLLDEIKDSVDHPKVHEAVAHLQALLNPYLSSTGVRATKVSNHFIELLIPHWWRTKNDEGALDEGVLVSVGLYAVKYLNRQTSLFSHLPMRILRFHFETIHPANSRTKARLEWTPLQQETAWAALKEKSKNEVHFSVGFFNEDEFKVGELFVEVEFTLKEYLSHSPPSAADSSDSNL